MFRSSRDVTCSNPFLMYSRRRSWRLGCSSGNPKHAQERPIVMASTRPYRFSNPGWNTISHISSSGN